METVIVGLFWYLAFLISTTLHEAAHAFTAMKLGDLTAYHSGQVSLNPLPHIKREPWGMFVIPIASFLGGGWLFGWGSAPYDPKWAYEHPKKAAAMAAAGPMANFLLIILSGLLIHVGIFAGIYGYPAKLDSSVVEVVASGAFPIFSGYLLEVFFRLNTILFLFNILPFPPMDGSGIIPMYLSEENGRKFMAFIHQGIFLFAGLFVAWNLFGYIYKPLMRAFVGVLYWGHGG